MRKTGALIGIEELAASITAHGLLQNLLARSDEKVSTRVVTGGRRLSSLQRLAKAKTIVNTEDIACHVMKSVRWGGAATTQIQRRVRFAPPEAFGLHND